MLAYAGMYPWVDGDAHSDDLVVAAALVPRARAPGNRLDDQLDRLAPAAVRLIVEVAHANKPLAVALEELPGAALAWPQGEARLHAAVTGAARRR